MVLCSSFRLSLDERAVLEKGLSFIPTPSHINRLQLRQDLHNYHRKLKILDFFTYNSDYSHLLFTNPSVWEPESKLISPQIRTLIEHDLATFSALKVPSVNRIVRHSNKSKSNITEEQQRALTTLRKLDNVIIKPADKGGQIVLQDRTDYLLEANRQLNDINYYKKLSSPLQLETQIMMRTIIDKLYLNKYINFKQLAYLYGPDNPRPRLFYLLPKIHKKPESWTVPFKVPAGRPIVSDCGSESYRVAEYIDYFLNPLSHMHASYVKDTYDFVNKLRTVKVPSNSFLFSIDVDSLYTNIETARGLLAVSKAFRNFPRKDRPDAEIIQLLEMTLTRNDFEFNNNYYLQTCGCAMGRKYSPAYADLYMADWEEEAFKKCAELPVVYLRYLDDIFGLWTGTEETFKQFLGVLNCHHPKIKLKCSLQWERVEFLDTQVFFIPIAGGKEKKLATKVYFKDTDRHALLHKASYHPRHTFRGLIKSQLIRFHRICTFPDDVEEATSTLFSALKHRGYASRFLRKIKSEVKQQFQNIYEHKKQPTNKQLVPCVQTYSQYLHSFNLDIKSHFVEAQGNCEALRDFKMIMAYRRNKNLKDILVHTAVDRRKTGNDPWLLSHIPFIFNGISGRGHPIREIISPQVTNVIYVVQCQHCRIIYVGETGRALKIRIMEHVNNIKKGHKDNVLYTHFQTHGIHNFKYIGLEQNSLWSTNQRIRREIYLIEKLDTVTPNGLNERT